MRLVSPDMLYSIGSHAVLFVVVCVVILCCVCVCGEGSEEWAVYVVVNVVVCYVA